MNPSDAAYQMRYAGSRTEMEIPLHHPWLEWLQRHQHEMMDNGGLAPHGVLTMTLGGVTQRFDLTEVRSLDYRGSGEGTATTIWRMYGNPASG
jgi:hypothetical protein